MMEAADGRGFETRERLDEARKSCAGIRLACFSVTAIEMSGKSALMVSVSPMRSTAIRQAPDQITPAIESPVVVVGKDNRHERFTRPPGRTDLDVRVLADVAALDVESGRARIGRRFTAETVNPANCRRRHRQAPA